MTYVGAKMRATLIQLIDISKLRYDRREPTISQPDQKSSCVLFAVQAGTVNSKSFVGKVLLRIKWKFELN